jgi:hypothetical protein
LTDDAAADGAADGVTGLAQAEILENRTGSRPPAAPATTWTIKSVIQPLRDLS